MDDGVWTDRLLEGWGWAREAWDEDTAQQAALETLERGVNDPLAYIRSVARFVCYKLKYPNRIKAEDGMQVRVQRLPWSPEHSEGGGGHGGNPESLLLIYEELRHRRQEALTRLTGQVRKADCHPERPHFGRGLCSQCYERDVGRKPESQQTRERRNAYKRDQRASKKVV